MKALIAPGMLLISRLSFANKFILISLLFFVPLVWLSYTVIHSAWQKIEITHSQRKGLELLNQTQQTLQAAERFRDSRLIAAYQMGGDYANRADEHFKALQKTVDELGEIDAHFTNDEAYTKPLSELQAAIKKARNVSVSNEASMEATFGNINALVIGVRNVEKAILQLSGLSQDSNPETKSMIDFAIRDLFPYAEVLGKLRGIGGYSLTQNYLNSATANELDDIMGKLYDIQPLLLKNAKLMVPTRYQNLQKEAEDFSQALTTVLQSVDRNIIGATDLNKPWSEFVDETTQVIDRKFFIATGLLDAVDARLGSRQDDESGKLNLISAAIAFVMLLIIYLYSAFYLSLRTSIDKLVEATDRMAEGDMRISMTVATRDELGHLTERFNATAARIRNLIAAVQTTSSEVKEQTEGVSRITQVTSDAITQQMQETEQAASAITEMSSNFNEVADFSSQAENAAQSANEEASTGRQKVKQTLADINSLAHEINSTAEVIDQLAKDSANISQVLVQIKGIAEQTNLLALNAAIEAARAGEHGRGFAVVADEVRSLSQRTHQSTEEIEEMIAKILSGVDNAVSAMADSHKMAGNTVTESKQVEAALEAINEKISTIVEMNSHIAEAVKQQAMTAEDIDRNIVGISRVAEDNVKNAKETTQASLAMSGKVNELAHMLTSFKID